MTPEELTPTGITELGAISVDPTMSVNRRSRAVGKAPPWTRVGSLVQLRLRCQMEGRIPLCS